MSRRVLATVFLLGVGLVSATAAASDSHETGRAIYNFRCYFCHGYSGDAQTLAARYLSPPLALLRTHSHSLVLFRSLTLSLPLSLSR